MEYNVTLQNTNISYTDIGQGNVVLLLHGYLETKEVWNSFAKKLAENYRVIAPDIPGHGNSAVFAETHSMEALAQKINDLLVYLQIDSCATAGHSMGGYIMLALAAEYPEKVERMLLFHSSIYSDSNEKKANRLREIELIETGKLELIVNTALPNTFAAKNVDKFGHVIATLKTRALVLDPKGVCALLRGMITRPDRQEFIGNFEKPLLFIFGQHDNYIAVEPATKMVALNTNSMAIWLENSGHMGFIEQEEEALQNILYFIK